MSLLNYFKPKPVIQPISTTTVVLSTEHSVARFNYAHFETIPTRGINYTFSAKYSLLNKQWPQSKAAAVAHARVIYGENIITIGDNTLFENRVHNARGYWRCEACAQFPKSMLAATRYKKPRGLFGPEGARWNLQQFISHMCGSPHKKAINESRNEEKRVFLIQNPSEKVENYKTNSLLRECIKNKRVLYDLRVKQISIVYADMKCLTISANSFASRQMAVAHAKYMIELQSEPFAPFKPKNNDTRYDSPTAHGRYRQHISNDISDRYVKPLFGDSLLSCGIAYDGWRAFAELYIHGCRCVFKNGTVRHVVVALVDPPVEGAKGCAESFKIAYTELFDTKEEFDAFCQKISSQTTDKAAVNAGSENGANILIRRDIIRNDTLPEIICANHCGHNAWKDWLSAHGIVGLCITDHDNFVSFTHRGDIQKDFANYCDKVIFREEVKENIYKAKRVQSAGRTRMASHCFKSMETAHEATDCWMLFLDDRSSNGRDSTVRFAAVEQYRKFVNYKKMRTKYLVMDLMRLYSIFDKTGQITGIGVLELHDCKGIICHQMRVFKNEYGPLETYFYTEMLSHDEYNHYVYDYKLNHIDHVHLELIKCIKSEIIPTRTEHGVIRKIMMITNENKWQCEFLRTRDDVIDMFIERIQDRCFEHDVVPLIGKFRPKLWVTQVHHHGTKKFIDEYNNDDIESLAVFWPSIEVDTCKKSMVVIKAKFVDEFAESDTQLTLNQFGIYVIKSYQYDPSMQSVCVLYGNMVSILPTAMIIEIWNSFSTAVWSDHRKSMTPKSIFEFINVKINGPPQNKYDSRVCALNIVPTSRERSINIELHCNQPYVASFFRGTKENNEEMMKQIEALQSIAVKGKNVSNMKQFISQNKGKKSNKITISRYQQNITSYFDTKNTYFDTIFNNTSLLTHLFTFVIGTHSEIIILQSINKSSYHAARKFSYRHMTLECFFNIDEPEYISLFTDGQEAKYNEYRKQRILDDDVEVDDVYVSWHQATVNDLLCYMHEIMQEGYSKKDIRLRIMSHWKIQSIDTVQKDWRCKIAMKIFKDRIRSGTH